MNKNVILLITLSFTVSLLCFVDSVTRNETLLLMKNKTFYCDAHKECFEIGQKTNQLGHMVGQNIHRLLDENSFKSRMWLNKHCLLHPVCHANAAWWIYGEERSVINGSTIGKKTKKEMKNQNNDGLRRVALYRAGRRTEVPSNTVKKYAYGCELGPVKKWESSVRLELLLSDIRKSDMLRADSDDTTGCFSRPRETTLIDCAIK